jgi:predicted O-methyltransferase YrrM
MTEYPNWFNLTAKHNFETFLEEFKGKPVNFLQIGAFTGDASIWMLDNILTNPESSLTDVDTWLGSAEVAHDSMNFSDVEVVYDSRVSKYPNIFKYKSTSDDYKVPGVYFDFIYIDGDHEAYPVFCDATHFWPNLAVGGLMAFDDYLWGEYEKEPYETPKRGIDNFLGIPQYKSKLEVVCSGSQVWIRKTG